MQTECSAKASEFARVEGRPVVAEFDGGALTSEAGGLLLGATCRLYFRRAVKNASARACASLVAFSSYATAKRRPLTSVCAR